MSPTSSPISGSSDEPRSSSVDSSAALTKLIAELLKGGTRMANFVTRRRWHLDVAMRDAEATELARHIARLVARRWEIKGDLNDATDVAGGGGTVASWLERALTSDSGSRELPRELAQDFKRPAVVPSSPQEPPAAPSSSPEAEVHDRDGRAVPGTGPAKAAFLDGFEEM